MNKLDEMLGYVPVPLEIQPAPWWMNHPDAETAESRLAAWAKGRDFKVVRGPYLSINSTIKDRESRFVDAQFSFEYTQAAEGAEPIYFTPTGKLEAGL